MAYNPISGAAIQYEKFNGQVADGYYLKFYKANTTTPLSMATNATGGTTLAKCKLNDRGYPITNPLDNDSIFIPFVNQSYRFVLYKNATDADNNDTAAADVNIPEVLPLATLSQGITSDVEFTGIEGQTVITIPYTVGFVRVLYNGIMLASSDYTADNGISITLSEPVQDSSDIITVLDVSYDDVEFTGTTTDTLGVTYKVGKIRVLYNGVYLSRSDYTATDGTSIVLNEPIASVDDVVTVVRLV